MRRQQAFSRLAFWQQRPNCRLRRAMMLMSLSVAAACGRSMNRLKPVTCSRRAKVAKLLKRRQVILFLHKLLKVQRRAKQLTCLSLAAARLKEEILMEITTKKINVQKALGTWIPSIYLSNVAQAYFEEPAYAHRRVFPI